MNQNRLFLLSYPTLLIYVSEENIINIQGESEQLLQLLMVSSLHLEKNKHVSLHQAGNLPNRISSEEVLVPWRTAVWSAPS